MNVKKSDRLYKSDRLNYIVNRMRVCEDITPTKLAEELHVSERTVYRDLRNLEKGSALAKKYSRREGRYLLETELNLPPLTLTPSEALSLFTAASNPALSSDNFFAADLRSGLKKVAHLLTAEAAHHAETKHSEDGAKHLEDEPGPLEDHDDSHSEPNAHVRLTVTSDSIQRPTMEIIRRAMRSNRKLHLMYWSPASDSERELIVAPYDLRAVGVNWYLLANSEEHGAIRTFKISRVRKAQILTDRFRFPRKFSADTSFERAWQAAGGNDEEINVVVRFAPSVASLVRDSRGHQFTDLVYEDSGALVCTASVNSIKEISWWILSYGSRAEVLSPPELRAQFAQTVQEMTALYAQPPAPVVPQALPEAISAPQEISDAVREAQDLPMQAVVRVLEPATASRVR